MTATDMKTAFFDLFADAVADRVLRRIEESQAKAEAPILSDYPDMMTRKEVSTALRVSVRHVITMTAQGKLGPCKVTGNKALYQKSEIIKFIKSKSKAT